MSGIRALASLLLLAAARQDPAPTLDRLLEQLSDERVELRTQAVDALGRLDRSMLPELRERMKLLPPEARGRLAQAVIRIEDRFRFLEYLPPLRLVTLHLKEQPARSAFKILAVQTGLPIKVETIPDDRPVTVDIEGETPLQALNSLCRAAMLGSLFEGAPDWRGRLRPSGKSGIRIHEVAPYYHRPNPVAWVRHYKISAGYSGESLGPGINLFFLNVTIRTTPGNRPHSVSALELSTLEDKEGRDLLPLIDRRPKDGDLILRVGEIDVRKILTLRTQEPGAPQIGRLSGKLTLRYPKEVLWVRFPGPEKSVETTARGMGFDFTLKKYVWYRGRHEFELKLVRLNGETISLLDLDHGRPFDINDLELVTAWGRSLCSSGYCATGGGPVAGLQFDMNGSSDDPAAELRFAWAERFVEDVVEFDLKGLCQ